jgi:uncharacterized protein (TIGR03067 family)
MRGRCLLSAAFVLTLLVSASADDKTDKNKDKLDPEKLVGTYTYVSGERSGDKVPEDNLKKGTVVITKDTITLKSDDASFVIKYKLDAKKTPATLEMEITEGPQGVGTKTGGIISMKGEEVKLCYAAMGGEAPKDFAAKKDSGHHYFVLKKKK